MSGTIAPSEHILINDEAVQELKNVPALRGARVVLQIDDAETAPLPGNVQEILLRVLTALVTGKEVVIGRVQDELTSTVAADMLGISRPTLMKWVREDKIGSFRVGSHTRFQREEVFQMKKRRAEDRRKAILELRELTSENSDAFDD